MEPGIGSYVTRNLLTPVEEHSHGSGNVIVASAQVKPASASLSSGALVLFYQQITSSSSSAGLIGDNVAPVATKSTKYCKFEGRSNSSTSPNRKGSRSTPSPAGFTALTHHRQGTEGPSRRRQQLSFPEHLLGTTRERISQSKQRESRKHERKKEQKRSLPFSRFPDFVLS